MSPLDPLRRPDGITGSVDYMELFDPKSDWAGVKSHIRVFKLYPQFISESPDEQLRRIMDFVKSNNIALALEAGILTYDKKCGHDIEGYGGQFLVGVMQRVRRLGGSLQYLAMDEPLAYGHLHDGPAECRTTVEALAADATRHLREIQQNMPEIQVGDIEPPGDGKDWKTDQIAWMAAFHAAYGKPLAFYHLDLDWRSQWMERLSAAAAAAQDAKVPLGVIYNGVDGDDDASWAKDVEAHYTELESAGSSPAEVLFQSWRPTPTHVLPPQSHITATGIIAQYLRPIPSMSVSGTKSGWGGSLHAPGGAPVAGARIELEERGVDAPRSLVSIKGSVPKGTQNAIFALRINAECNCSGTGRLAFGTPSYQEEGGTIVTRRFSPRMEEWAGGRPLGSAIQPSGQKEDLLRIDAEADKPMRLNSQNFSAREDVHFQATFPVAASPDARDTGDVAVIFLDASGKEISRNVSRIEPSWTSSDHTLTDANGNFSLSKPQDGEPNHIEKRLYFMGSDALRPLIRNLSDNDLGRHDDDQKRSAAGRSNPP